MIPLTMRCMTSELAANSDQPVSHRLAVWVATGLGVGLATPAPGTVGGLWGLLLLPAIASLGPLGAQLAVVVLILLAAVALSTRAAQELGGQKDPQAICIDEIAALPIVFLGAGPLSLSKAVAGFLCFRLFDIWKPWPVRWAEQLPGGWGVVADDVVAALYAWAALHALLAIDRVAGIDWIAP